MSTYTMNMAGQIPAIQTIDIGPYSTGSRLPNKKLSITIHEAHGGYIVEMTSNPGQAGDLYIIADDKEIGQELGKIITMKVLKENHE